MAKSVRTDKALSTTLRGRIFATARKAFAIGNRQAPIKSVDRKTKAGKEYKQNIGSFSGVSALSGVQYPSGAFYAVTKADGPWDRLPSESAEFKSVQAAAKAAYPDVLALKWTTSVQNLLNEMMKVRGDRAGGTRSVSTADIKGFTF